MKRRDINVFSLSFLDCMFCGFGAVILLVMIVNSDMLRRRDEAQRTLRVEAERLETELGAATRRLAGARAALRSAREEQAQVALQAARALAAIERERSDLAGSEEGVGTRAGQVGTLMAELRALAEEKSRLERQAREQPEQGRRIRRVAGEGDRQYLTGLKVSGRRVVILVDASASMLDETIVNVIRLKNLPPQRRRNAPKWRRALATVDWLVSQLRAGADFQIYVFDERVRAVVAGSEGEWLDSGDAEKLNRSLDRLREVAPAGGTNLYDAFAALRALRPRPDNVYLITDGLPTRGRKPPGGRTVSPEERMAHLRRAVAELPSTVPVNTILLPMEGDPEAASAFWKLAVSSGGAFLTPSRDWP